MQTTLLFCEDFPDRIASVVHLEDLDALLGEIIYIDQIDGAHAAFEPLPPRIMSAGLGPEEILSQLVCSIRFCYDRKLQIGLLGFRVPASKVIFITDLENWPEGTLPFFSDQAVLRAIELRGQWPD